MMKLFLVLSLAVAASADSKSKYVRNLLGKAVPTANSQLRRLDQAVQEEAFEVNIAAYSVKFEQCQFVKSYSADLAADEESTTVLSTERFVMFRLCPSNCTSCTSNYGEYLVDLDSYLESTVEYFQAYQEAMCEACDATCAADDAAAADEGDAAADGEDAADGDGGRRNLGKNKFYNLVADCASCVDKCDLIDNMQANYVIDATDYLQCTQVYLPADADPVYIGPMCGSSGSKIKIGIFSDADCLFLDESKSSTDITNIMVDGVQWSLTHSVLQQTYTNTCISCKEPVEQNENAEGDAEEDADEVTEMCENLYGDAAKCEKAFGFASGYANYDGYENQLAQEEVVCEYMASLKAGTYNEAGEIVVTGAGHSKSGKSTTGGQKFALVFFILGTVGLAMYSAMLHSKLVKGSKPDLASQGAMA
jgi:hypothetical protein